MQRPLPPRVTNGPLRFTILRGACTLVDCEVCKGNGQRELPASGTVWCASCGGYGRRLLSTLASPALTLSIDAVLLHDAAERL